MNESLDKKLSQHSCHEELLSTVKLEPVDRTVDYPLLKKEEPADIYSELGSPSLADVTIEFEPKHDVFEGSCMKSDGSTGVMVVPAQTLRGASVGPVLEIVKCDSELIHGLSALPSPIVVGVSGPVSPEQLPCKATPELMDPLDHHQNDGSSSSGLQLSSNPHYGFSQCTTGGSHSMDVSSSGVELPAETLGGPTVNPVLEMIKCESEQIQGLDESLLHQRSSCEDQIDWPQVEAFELPPARRSKRKRNARTKGEEKGVGGAEPNGFAVSVLSDRTSLQPRQRKARRRLQPKKGLSTDAQLRIEEQIEPPLTQKSKRMKTPLRAQEQIERPLTQQRKRKRTPRAKGKRKVKPPDAVLAEPCEEKGEQIVMIMVDYGGDEVNDDSSLTGVPRKVKPATPAAVPVAKEDAEPPEPSRDEQDEEFLKIINNRRAINYGSEEDEDEDDDSDGYELPLAGGRRKVRARWAHQSDDDELGEPARPAAVSVPVPPKPCRDEQEEEFLNIINKRLDINYGSEEDEDEDEDSDGYELPLAGGRRKVRARWAHQSDDDELVMPATPAAAPVAKEVAVPPEPCRDEEIPKVMINYGSEEDESDEYDGSDGDDGSDGCDEILPALVPRSAKALWAERSDDEEQMILSASTAAVPVNFNAPQEQTQLPSRPGGFLDFEWSDLLDQPVPPPCRREEFVALDGPTTEASDPYEVFSLIWDRDFVARLAQETNRYARQVIDGLQARGLWSERSCLADWKGTDADELYVYLAITLAMGLFIKASVAEYWDSDVDIFISPVFQVYMPLRRFRMLSRCLHFQDNASVSGQVGLAQAKLSKVQPLLEHLNRRFQELYNCGQNLTFDVSLLQWKGWQDTSQSIPCNAAVRIKSYELCDSQTGYLWRFILKTNKLATTSGDPFTSSTTAAVLELAEGLEYKGHTMWMDEYCNSPALARKLKSLGFDCAGTLRTNRQFVPEELANLRTGDIRRGQLVGMTSGDVDVVIWRDNSRVSTLSTYHGSGVSVTDGSARPTLMRDYNIYMGGVDKRDQVLADYPIERKRTRVWYKKVFRRFLNLSVMNAFIIHRHNSATKLWHRKFRVALVKSILLKHRTFVDTNDYNVPPNPDPSVPMNTSIHFPADYPFVTKNNRHRKRCAVCRKYVSTYCAGCDKCVCDRVCFALLHS